MDEIQVDNGDITLRVEVTGDGPVVLCVHGWPELAGDAPANSWVPDAPRDAAFLPLLADPPDGPLSFLSDEALDRYEATFERTGMTGAFNRYRALTADAATVGDLAGGSEAPDR